ncbi:ATP-dependent DNA helicase pif1-like protein [Labeo rohita]|uniref:ATP-dependent DNA helicase pif1-like protein n=1 Tax=Labeo rohita TaxID=84645 RepID=A0A498NL24_LABRO|nr:ATP-dependent DNA helicase pif1-like protein [Labeo rohita]
MITLTQIMRQRDDLAYAELLNRLRVKQKQDKLNDADRCMLETVIRFSTEDCPTDALHIYATNKEVENNNTEAISSRFSNIINIDAQDYKKDPRTGEMKKQAIPCKGDKHDLLDTLQIAIGARVMLTRNIDVEDGLVNGTFGNVAKITTVNRDDVSYVQLIGLHLDNVNAGQKHRNKAPDGDDSIVYIERKGGGVAMYVKNNLEVHLQMYIHNVTDLEYLVLKVEAPKQALIAVIYRPPNYNLTGFLGNLDALLTSLEVFDFKPVIVCGDFNEDQLSHGNKPILGLFQEKGYTQLITSGTTENNTLLDPVFISGTHLRVTAGVLQTYYSYHDPVYCVLE